MTRAQSSKGPQYILPGGAPFLVGALKEISHELRGYFPTVRVYMETRLLVHIDLQITEFAESAWHTAWPSQHLSPLQETSRVGDELHITFKGLPRGTGVRLRAMQKGIWQCQWCGCCACEQGMEEGEWTSAGPPLMVAKVGRPQLMASITVSPKASYSAGWTKAPCMSAQGSPYLREF